MFSHLSPLLLQLEGDTTWRDLRLTEPLALKHNLTVNQIAPQLHLLSPGAALQARYSEYHVVRAQVLGEARYTLIPPAHLKDMYLFPSIHLSHQQSQV